MRIAFIGAGAVGGLLGGMLARANHDVLFLARGAHLEALRRDGLRVETPLGDFHLQDPRATESTAEIGPVDVVAVAVKAWQVPEVAPHIRPLLGERTMVVPVQNGVEAPDQLTAALGPGHVLGGVCYVFSTLVAPGHIRHIGPPPRVSLGSWSGSDEERMAPLRDALTDAGIAAKVVADIRAEMWEKFLYVVSFGGLGAVLRAPAGVFVKLPEARQMLEQAMREILSVARARHIAVQEEAIPKALGLLEKLPFEATASMQRDIIQGRPSELEAQNGAVVRLGREAEVPTPLHQFIYYSLLPLELRARGKLTFSV